MEPAIILVVVVVIGLPILFRLLAGSFDGQRVEDYIRERGWELVDRSWAPFGPGWFGEQDSRIYQVIYRDQAGNVHRAHVKTSMGSGVYFTNDEIVEEAPRQEPKGELSLEEENRQLKERIRELEGR